MGFFAKLGRDLRLDARISRPIAAGQQPIGAAATLIGPADWLLAGAAALVAGALYLWLGGELIGTAFFADWNYAFDMDSPRFVEILGAAHPAPPSPDRPISWIMKHPFLPVFRPPVRLLTLLGLSPDAAATALIAAIGGLTVAASHLYATAFGLPRPEAVLATILFAASSTQLFIGFLIESYGLAAFGIVVLYLMTLLRLRGAAEFPRGRFLVAAYQFGITSTNFVQAGIAELTVWVTRLGLERGLVRTISFCLIALALFGILILIGYPTAVLEFLADPVRQIKLAFWVIPHESVKVGLLGVLQVFFGYTMVAPEFTTVPIPEDGMAMHDFRTWAFSPIGTVAIWLWLALVGIGLALFARRDRPMLAALGLALAGNVALHLYYQDRGSVFLYSGHVHFLVFALCLPALRALGRGTGAIRLAGRWALGGFVALVAVNNFGRALEFTAIFG